MYLILTSIIAICKFFAKETVYLYAISSGSVGWIEIVDSQIVAQAVPACEVVPIVYRPMVMYSCLGVHRVSFVAISDPLRYSAECIVSADRVIPFALLVADMLLGRPGQAAPLLQAVHPTGGEQWFSCRMGWAAAVALAMALASDLFRVWEAG